MGDRSTRYRRARLGGSRDVPGPGKDSLSPRRPADVDPRSIPSPSDLGVSSREPDDQGVLPFRGGERAGRDRVETYLWNEDRLREYKETRNGLLGADYSSKLSAWLTHRCLSPRYVYDEVKRYERGRVSNESTY